MTSHIDTTTVSIRLIRSLAAITQGSQAIAVELLST